MASSPPRSRRGKILNNLQRQLETITVAGGYTHDVVEVTTRVRNWRDLPATSTPVIFILDESTKYKYHAGKLTERTLFVNLFCVMKDELQMDMEEFIADVEDCLVANERLHFTDTGHVCQHIRIDDVVTDSQLFSEVEGSQLFKMRIEIIYTARVDSIR